MKDLRSSKIIDDVLSNFCYYFDSNILVSSDGTITPQRHSLLDFLRFKFAFCSKRMKTIRTIKNQQHVLTLFLLIMQTIFTTI